MGMKNRYHVVLKVELDLYVNADSEKECKECVENMELPHGYREDSFEIMFTEKIK